MPFYCIFITVSLDSLKGYVGTGQQVGKTEIGLPGSKERVNFNNRYLYRSCYRKSNTNNYGDYSL